MEPHSIIDHVPRSAVAGIYGVLNLGETHVALPLEQLREVVPAPARFVGLPAAAPGLLGAVNLRGCVVPVLDLRRAIGLEAQAAGGSGVVAIVRHDGRTLGLRADGVRGLTTPREDSIHPVESSDGALLYSGSFERREDSSVVSVIDAASLLQLPGVPSLRERPVDATASRGARVSSASGSGRKPLMLVRCGDLGLAIGVTEIHTTLPSVEPKASSLGGRVCRGIIEHDGIEIPAVDPLALLELGSLPPSTRYQALLLRYPEGLVALLVSRAVDIVPVATDELLALPRGAVRRPECFRAMLHVSGHGEHLVFAEGALAAETQLRALSTTNTTTNTTAARRRGPATAALAGASRDAGADAAKSGTAGRAIVTYHAGVEMASLLTQVREIVPLPEGRAMPARAHDAVVGLVSHRRRAVMLVCLATLLGRPSSFDERTARVLLVDAGDACLGFVVDRLDHVETIAWEQPAAASASASKPGAHPLAAHRLIEVGSAAERRTLHLVDLLVLAREVIGTAADLNNDIDTEPSAFEAESEAAA